MASKQRHGVNEKERSLIREYHRNNPLTTQRSLAEWASNQFGRRINAIMIRRTLSDRFNYVDSLKFTPGSVGLTRYYEADFPLLKKALYEWFLKVEGKLTITGDMVQQAAHELWVKMPDFRQFKEPKWSSTWLTGWKARFGIKRFRKYGEAGSVNLAEAAARLAECQEIAQGYDPEDTYNTDETRLFWLTVPDITLGTQRVPRTKQKKDRITALFTSNATGTHKLSPWVIGKAKNPRCFGSKSYKIANLPLVWRSNKKAWMTSLIFLEFLEWFANQIRAKKPYKKVVLFMDSFSAHESAVREIQERDANDPSRQKFTNIRIEFLPKNATSVYQPMDQGIIANVKVYYRRKWLVFMVLATLDGRDPLTTITLF